MSLRVIAAAVLAVVVFLVGSIHAAFACTASGHAPRTQPACHDAPEESRTDDPMPACCREPATAAALQAPLRQADDAAQTAVSQLSPVTLTAVAVDRSGAHLARVLTPDGLPPGSLRTHLLIKILLL